MAKISRRKLAIFAADKLVEGKAPEHALKEVAAYLIETNRTKEVELVVRDIEHELAQRGTVVTDVASAHPLTPALKKQITELVNSKNIQFRETIDGSLLGGVRVDVPGKRFDGTIRRKLTQLRAKQV